MSGGRNGGLRTQKSPLGAGFGDGYWQSEHGLGQLGIYNAANDLHPVRNLNRLEGRV